MPDAVSRISTLEKDMYFGNGPQNPSVTTRLAVLEEAMTNVEASVDKINKTMNKGLWLLLGTLATAVLNIILHLSGK